MPEIGLRREDPCRLRVEITTRLEQRNHGAAAWQLAEMIVRLQEMGRGDRQSQPAPFVGCTGYQASGASSVSPFDALTGPGVDASVLAQHLAVGTDVGLLEVAHVGGTWSHGPRFRLPRSDPQP